MALFKKSLRFRITFLVVLLVLALFIANAVVSTKQAKVKFESLLDEKYVATTEYLSEVVEEWFAENTGVLNAMAAYADSYTGELSGMHPFLAEVADGNEDVTEVYFCDNSGKGAFSSYNPPADFDARTRAWYVGAKEKSGVYFTQPYVDMISGTLCITASLATDKGVAGMDLNLSALTECIPAIEEGYSFVATDENNIVIHKNPDFSLSGETAVTLETAAGGAYLKAMEDDSLFTDYDKTPSYITAEEVEINGWTVALVTPKSSYDAPVKAMVSIFVFLTVLFCIVAAVIVALVSIKITKPIVDMTKQVNKIADDIKAGEGDTTARIVCKSQDEIGRVSEGVNSLMAELDNLIPSAKNASDTVTGRAQDMAQITEQINDAIAGITQAVEDIANGATQQAQDVQAATESVEEIGEVIDSVAETAGTLNNIAKEMREASLTTEEQVHNLQEATDTMVSGVDRIADQIKETSKAVDSINDKVSAITEIAEQTNLLSLNASIEAARAGAMGRGFAVVAEEIGKLAVNSAEVAQSIKDEMDALLNTSQAAVEESEKVHDLTVSQAKVLEETTDIIKSLMTQINETVDNVGNIEAGVQNVVKSKIAIADAMDSLSAISEENAASSEETSATTTEINRTVETLSDASRDLNQVAHDLNECLSVFK
ncbi:MAG: methyl-accepting chemotaxis protein [Lachnospiraceae bacterium]|nr:methyl-accepting chemotaxis protein [Lachnospiraceae bacterium]